VKASSVSTEPGEAHWTSPTAARAALDLLAALVRHGVTCITRLRLDAALYEPATPRTPRTCGRPPTKDKHLPNLSTVLTDVATQWQRVAVPSGSGEGERIVEIHSATALWRHAGIEYLLISPGPGGWLIGAKSG
jgi:hypothetical protein